MRNRLDRIRHAILFELIGLVLVVAVLSQFGFEMGHVGVMGVVFSVVATGWNYVYNILFDNYMMKRTGSTVKTTMNRVRSKQVILFLRLKSKNTYLVPTIKTERINLPLMGITS